MTQKSELISRQKQDICSSIAPEYALGTTQPTSEWVLGYPFPQEKVTGAWIWSALITYTYYRCYECSELGKVFRKMHQNSECYLSPLSQKFYIEISAIRRYAATNTSKYVRGKKVKVKWSRYRPGVAQRVGRGIALLFHDRGTRRGWMVSVTPRPQCTPGTDPVPILQEAGWALGPVWTGGKSRPHRNSIPDRPARSQSLYRLS